MKAGERERNKGLHGPEINQTKYVLPEISTQHQQLPPIYSLGIILAPDEDKMPILKFHTAKIYFKQ